MTMIVIMIVQLLCGLLVPTLIGAFLAMKYRDRIDVAVAWIIAGTVANYAGISIFLIDPLSKAVHHDTLLVLYLGMLALGIAARWLYERVFVGAVYTAAYVCACVARMCQLDSIGT